jgi:hypothetical protein
MPDRRELSASLASEILLDGSLVGALFRALERMGSQLHGEAALPRLTHRWGTWITVGDRQVSVWLATDTGASVVEGSAVSQPAATNVLGASFWEAHFVLASATCNSIAITAQAILRWLEDRVSSTDLATEFDFVTRSSGADSYERGTIIEDAWARIPTWEPSPQRHVLLLAGERARLRAMLPFQSLNRVGFSRRNLVTFDLPVIEPLREERFKLTDYNGAVTYVEGDPQAVLDALEAWIDGAADRAETDDSQT